jgi:hypothetical protein
MKKLLIAIFLFVAVSTQAQDTLKVFTKIIDFGKPTRVDYKCCIIQTGNRIDTIYTELSKGSSQGFGVKDSVSTEEQELLNVLTEIQKIESQVQELAKQKEQLTGVAIYISRKYGIDIEKLLKKIR